MTQDPTQQAILRDVTLGGPGLDGYVFHADTYCVECGESIARSLAAEGKLVPVDDVYFGDTETQPQPIFFGEHPDRAVHCADCGEFMYGEYTDND